MSDGVGTATRTKSHTGAAVVLFALLGLFVLGGLYSGWIFLTTVESVVFGRPVAAPAPIVSVRDLPGVVKEIVPRAKDAVEPSTVVQPQPTPIPDEPLPVWNGRDRVTILLLGIDQRDDENEVPTRSDTMILLTMDPVGHTAAMLSLPRDLWVPIPGYGENKLNTAHFFGEQDEPGSGPQAARRTIQYNFGVPINYVARVDFRGFERLIDAIDGITIDVERAILDNEYPNENYGINRMYIPVGPQRMSGGEALRYARSRHADSDFGRIHRQQRVLQAARAEVLQLKLLPRLPQMLGILFGSVTTDIPIRDMLALANLGAQIPSSAITSRTIDASMINDVNGDGTALIPEREEIRELVQDLFYDPVVKQEAARIVVLNGTMRDGLATVTGEALKTRSLNVVNVDTASRSDYAETQIVVHAENKPETVKKLAALLRVAPENIRSGPYAGTPADISIVLGTDFRLIQ